MAAGHTASLIPRVLSTTSKICPHFVLGELGGDQVPLAVFTLVLRLVLTVVCMVDARRCSSPAAENSFELVT